MAPPPPPKDAPQTAPRPRRPYSGYMVAFSNLWFLHLYLHLICINAVLRLPPNSPSSARPRPPSPPPFFCSSPSVCLTRPPLLTLPSLTSPLAPTPMHPRLQPPLQETRLRSLPRLLSHSLPGGRRGQWGERRGPPPGTENPLV